MSTKIPGISRLSYPLPVGMLPGRGDVNSNDQDVLVNNGYLHLGERVRGPSYTPAVQERCGGRGSSTALEVYSFPATSKITKMLHLTTFQHSLTLISAC